MVVLTNINALNSYICWLVVSTPLKDMKINWDDEIPNIWETKSHVPVTTNQL